MMKAVELFGGCLMSVGKRLLLLALMAGIFAGTPAKLLAQDYWGWQPQPQPGYYPYYTPQPEQQPSPSRRRSGNTKKPKKTPAPKPKKTPDPKPEKTEKKVEKKVEKKTEKKADQAEKRDESENRAAKGTSPRSDDETQPAQAPEEALPDTSAFESANPYSGSRSNGHNTGMPASSAAGTIPLSSRSARTGEVMIWENSDSLPAIARVAGVTPSELLEYNRISRTELRAGQALVLPHSQDLTTANSSNGLPKALAPSQQMAREVWRGVRGKKRIALTFDAGSGKDGVDDLLGHLQGTGAAATFFVTGDFVKKNRSIIEKIDQAGFPIHNHSWSHPEFTKISDEKMRDELTRTDEIIQEVTGKSTKPYWRPPFGDRNARVLRTAAEAGYQSIYWTIDVLDSVGEKKDPGFVVNRVLNPSKAGGDPDHYLDGAIILMHVGEPRTAAAVPQLVRSLRDRGFTLVTVEEILKP